MVVERFFRAEQLFHAPIHLRYLAIGLERMSPPRLVECAAAWRRLSTEQLPADAPPVFRDAVEEGRRELPRIERLLGRVSINLANGSADSTITVDGNPVSLSDLASPQWVMPGPHAIVAERPGHRRVERSVTVTAGSTEHAAVTFESDRVAVVERPAEYRTVTHPNPLRMVGLIVGGVGVAMVIGGAIAGAVGSGTFSDAEAACPNRTCPTQAAFDNLASADSAATAANVLLIGGAVAAVAGGVLFFVGKPRTESVRVGFSPRGASLTLTF